MKLQIITIFLFFFHLSLLTAQAPQSFSYQGVARDADGKSLASQDISLKIAIHQFTLTGTVVYEERHKDLLTNQFGLFSTQIGRGIPQIGIFSQISWGEGPFFLEVGIDPDNGNNYQLTSTNEALSVPYALYAEKSKEQDGDPFNEIQTISLTDNIITLSNGGGSVTLPASGGSYTAGPGISIAGNTIINTGDIDPSNDITNTTPAGGDLTGVYPDPKIGPNTIGPNQIIDGSITLNKIAPGVIPQKIIDLTDVNTTGLAVGQVLKWDGTSWVAAADNTGGGGASGVNTSSPISGDGGIASPVTLGQNGASTGQVLKWNGTSWTPMDDNTGTAYTAGSGIVITGSTISALDVSPTNELQNLSLNGATLGLSNSAGTVSLAIFQQSIIYDSTTQNLTISGGNTIKLGGFGNSLWKKTGTNLEPSDNALGGNIPSGNLSGGGSSGWNFLNFQGAGLLNLRKSTGSNVSIGSAAGSPDNGAISVFNPNNKQSVYLYSCSHNAGEIWAQSATGKINIQIGHNFNTEEGRIDVFGTDYFAGSLASLFANDGIGNISLANKDGNLLLNASQSYFDDAGGALRIYSHNAAVARMYSASGNGELLLSSLPGANLVLAGAGYDTTGYVSVWEPGGAEIGALYGCGHHVGTLSLSNPSNRLVIDLGHTDGQHLDNGFIGVYNKNSPPNVAVSGFYTDDDLGTMFTNNIEANQYIFADKTTGIWHTTVWDDDNGGVEMVRNKSAGTPKVYLYVDENDKGIVAADTIYAAAAIVASVKNFRMDHPKDNTKEIYYASIEGPEAAAYERGTGQVVDGKTFIPFSETYSWVINPATVTIQLTVNSTDTYGLAVVGKTAAGFWVKELKGGTGSFSFDWEAKGVRKGYEDYEVVRNKSLRLPDPGDGKKRTMPQRNEAHQH